MSEDLAVPVIDVSSPDALLAPLGVTDTSHSHVHRDRRSRAVTDPTTDPSPPGILTGGQTATIVVGILSNTSVAHQALDTTTTVVNSSDPTPIDWTTVLVPIAARHVRDPVGRRRLAVSLVVGDTEGVRELTARRVPSRPRRTVPLTSEIDALGFLVDEQLARQSGRAGHRHPVPGRHLPPVGEHGTDPHQHGRLDVVSDHHVVRRTFRVLWCSGRSVRPLGHRLPPQPDPDRHRRAPPPADCR